MKRAIIVGFVSAIIGVIALFIMHYFSFSPLDTSSFKSNGMIVGFIYLIIALTITQRRSQYDQKINRSIEKHTGGEREISNSEINNRIKDAVVIGAVGLIFFSIYFIK